MGNVSSKEEGEAESMGQGAPSTKKQEDRGAKAIGILHMLKMLEPVNRKIQKFFCSGRIHLIISFNSIMSAQINLLSAV